MRTPQQRPVSLGGIPSWSIARAHRHPVLMIALLGITLLAACGDSELADDIDTSLLPMTVVEWLFAPGSNLVDAEPAGLMHVSWNPMSTGENTITIELTDLLGDPLPLLSDASELELTVRMLAPDASPASVPLERETNIWRAESVELADTGWYQLDISLEETGAVLAEGRTWALLPDPSVHGADAVDLPDSDSDAEALYQQALEAYANWEAARWRESLSSGAGALVVTGFTVTDRPDEPAAMRVDSRYVDAFRDRADGTASSPPRFDFGSRITIGDEGWVQDADGGWLASPARRISTFGERADIYAGGTNILPGGSGTIDGIETDIVTFYLPPKGGQSEAWFAWWIDPETGNLMRAMMIAQMHYMVWDISDINGNIAIEPPPVDTVATPEPLD